MNFDWPVFKLEDCLDALIDYRGKTPEKTKAGIPLVTAKVIKGGRIETPSEFIATKDYDTWMRRGIPKNGDIVMTTEAPLGEVAQLGPEKIALAQRVITLRGKAGFLDSTYLLYLLQTEGMQDQLKARATGTTVLGIKQSELRKISVSVPPMQLQKDATSVLSALDDRITSLYDNQTTLEAIAQALFKSWFIDFDPVQAKQEGREPEGINAATATLFPNSFEESELGLVPRGWQVGKVENLIELAYGKALKASDRLTGSIPVYGSGGITGYHNKPLVNGPSIVVGRKGTVGSLYWEDQPFFPIDTVYYVKAKTPLTYCFYQLKVLGLEGMNTDGAVPGLNRNNVYRLPVVIPANSVMDSFDDLVLPIRNRIFTNAVQAQTIAALRDTLLSRLISGQLRLHDADKLLCEAAA